VFPAYVGEAPSVDPKRVAGRPREELAASTAGDPQAPGGGDSVRARVDFKLSHNVVDAGAYRCGREHERVRDLVRGSVGREEIDDLPFARGQRDS
jgi:hypothetical protein